MLRTACANPGLSVYTYLHGNFDFNKTSLAPPSTKAIIHNAPETRTAYSTHGTEVWYIRPANDHYRCSKFYNLATCVTRISDLVKISPTHCYPPHIPPADTQVITAYNLSQALKSNVYKLDPSHPHTCSIKKMAHIFMKKSIYKDPKMPTVNPRVTEKRLRVNKLPTGAYTQQPTHTSTSQTDHSNILKIKPIYNHR